MKRIKENLSEQGVLFSNHYVGDRLEENDEVYLFKDLIHKLDTSAITNSYSPEGGSMFAPIDQLAVITFALFKGITSSMMMADLVRNHLQFIYLAGGHIIARRTICDFRIKHKENIRKIFESTVNLAIDCGLVRKDQLFALDGAKIEANASFSKTRKKKEWEERQEKI
jgi:transposase